MNKYFLFWVIYLGVMNIEINTIDLYMDIY